MPEIGWRVLPLGCGGLVTGFDIADDGAMVCRTDVGNCYRWSGTKDTITNPNDSWQPLLTLSSMPAGSSARLRGNSGGWELAVAPSDSNIIYGIFPDDDSSVSITAKFWLYRSTDGGAHWTKTSVTMLNADSNTVDGSKNASGKIIIDPNNPDIVYCGLPLSSGDSFAVYRTNDGGDNFSAMPWAAPPIAMTPGVAGMAFDRSSGTVVVGGQTRTARILIPVAGQGIFESTDGGETWADTTPNGIGTIACSGYQGKFTDTGIYYGILTTSTFSAPSTLTQRGYLWRYKAGVWEQLDKAGGTFAGTKQTMVPATFNATFNGTAMTVNSVISGAVAIGQRIYVGNVNKGTVNGGSNPNWTLNNSNTLLTADAAALNATSGYPAHGIPIVDPRSGKDGYLTISGPNGLGVGYTSTNADLALGSITWGGATGGEIPSLSIPAYEPGWFANLPHGTNAFLGGTFTIIDQSGVCWWCGHQAFWHFTAIPNYAVSTATTSVSTGRGMEATVSQDVCMPSGCPYPVMGSQDVGVHRGTFVTYPADSYPVGGRPQCQSIDWAASDPSFMFAKIDTFAPTVAVMLANTAGLGGYSNNYGAMGSWTAFGVQPDGKYQASITADVQNGIGGNSGSTLTVSAIAQGTILIGQAVSLGTTNQNTGRGVILAQLSGTPGGIGTYDVSPQVKTCVATISNGSGGSGDVLNVSSNTGSTLFAVGQRIYGIVGPTWTFLGEIIALISGTGGNGTYQLSQSTLLTSRTLYVCGQTTATTSQTMTCLLNTQGGQIVATDPDHVVLVPSGNRQVQGFVPVYTANARDPSPTWAFTDLPTLDWTRRSHNNGGTAKLFAVGYGAQVGTVWAVACSNVDASTIYKSTDHGATWSVVTTLQIGSGSNYTVPYLFAVPGYPDHLWLTCLFTGGGQPMKLWRSTDGGANWSEINLPTAGVVPRLLCLGAPQAPGGYPTIFLQVWSGGNPGVPTPKLYFSTNGDAADPATLSWSVLGSTGTNVDMPVPGEITQIQSIHGDWNVFKRLYACETNCGYAFYQVSPDAVAPLRMRLKAA